MFGHWALLAMFLAGTIAAFINAYRAEQQHKLGGQAFHYFVGILGVCIFVFILWKIVLGYAGGE